MKSIFLSVLALMFVTACNTGDEKGSKSLLESMQAAKDADEGRALLAKFFSETPADKQAEKLKKFGQALGKAMLDLGMKTDDFTKPCEFEPAICSARGEDGKTLLEKAKEQGASLDQIEKLEKYRKRSEDNKRNEEVKNSPETEATMLAKISWKAGPVVRTSLDPNFIKQVNESATEIHTILTDANKQKDYYKQNSEAARTFGAIGLSDISENKKIIFKKDIYVLEAALKYLVLSGKYRAYMNKTDTVFTGNVFTVELAKDGLEKVLKNKADRREIDADSINRVHAFMSKHEITDVWTEAGRNSGLHNSINIALYDYAYDNKKATISLNLNSNFIKQESDFLNKQLEANKFYAWSAPQIAFENERKVYIAVNKDDDGIGSMSEHGNYTTLEKLKKK